MAPQTPVVTSSTGAIEDRSAGALGSERNITTSTGSILRVKNGATQRWQPRFTRRLWVSDLFVLVWVVYGTQIFWFGTGNAALSLAHDGRFSAVSYWLASALIVLLWWWSLSLTQGTACCTGGNDW